MPKQVDWSSSVTNVTTKMQQIRSAIESGIATKQSPARIQAVIQPILDGIKGDLERLHVEGTLLAELGRLLAGLNQLHVTGTELDPSGSEDWGYDALATAVSAPVTSRVGDTIKSGPGIAGNMGDRGSGPQKSSNP